MKKSKMYVKTMAAALLMSGSLAFAGQTAQAFPAGPVAPGANTVSAGDVVTVSGGDITVSTGDIIVEKDGPKHGVEIKGITVKIKFPEIKIKPVKGPKIAVPKVTIKWK